MFDATFTFEENLKVINSKLSNSLEVITKIAKPFAKAVNDSHMQSLSETYDDSTFCRASNPTIYWKLKSVRAMLA